MLHHSEKEMKIAGFTSVQHLCICPVECKCAAKTKLNIRTSVCKGEDGTGMIMWCIEMRSVAQVNANHER